MNEVTITFSDGSTRTYTKGTTFEVIAKDYPGKFPYVGVKVDNVIFSLGDSVDDNAKVEFIDFMDPFGAKMYKCGVMMIFEVALKELFKGFEVNFLHSHPKGVYAEIKGDRILTENEISNIKSKMSAIVSNNEKIKKFNVSKKDAIKFYKEHKYDEKSKNIQNFTENIVTFYVLHNCVNFYFTEMPNKTGSMNLYDIKYIGDNKIVILLPNKLTDGRVPEYVSYKKIIDSFNKSQTWLDLIGKRYLCDINKDVSNGLIKDFINLSEIRFNEEISDITKLIKERKNVKFVMIAGPSSSGKTTTTRRLKTYLDCQGYNTIVISTDDYFVDRDKTPRDEHGNYDFECLHAIDIEHLNKDIKDLLDGKDVALPVFDFVRGTKNLSDKKVRMNEKTIVLIEGLHSLNDDLVPIINENQKFKIYISPFIGVNIDRHNYISTTDLRLIRRIVRDNRSRALNVDKTFKLWDNVRKGEVKYIFPFIHQADIVLNTALNFEIGVLEVYALPLLLSVKIDSPYYEEARRLIYFLKEFCPIPSECVSKDSILREFIGGE